MSLNKYEQGLFDYLEGQPEERRHWRARVDEMARNGGDPGTTARSLERDLWEYFAERSEHVRSLRELNVGGLRRVSMQNLSDHLLRLFGPPRRAKAPPGAGPSATDGG